MQDDISRTSLGLGRIIAIGWGQYLANFLPILAIVLIIYVPINVALSFVPLDYLIEQYGFRAFRIYMSLVRLSEFLIGVIATIAIATLVDHSLRGIRISWLAALRHGLRRWWASIFTGLLAGLIILGMTLLLIVPGIIWSLYYYMFIFVVALRSLSGKKALDYSKSIVKGQWWRVLGYIIVIELFSACIMLPIIILYFFAPDSQLLDILSDTLIDIVAALSTVMTVVFFLNNDYLRNFPPPPIAPLPTPPALPDNDTAFMLPRA